MNTLFPLALGCLLMIGCGDEERCPDWPCVPFVTDGALKAGATQKLSCIELFCCDTCEGDEYCELYCKERVK